MCVWCRKAIELKYSRRYAGAADALGIKPMTKKPPLPIKPRSLSGAEKSLLRILCRDEIERIRDNKTEKEENKQDQIEVLREIIEVLYH